MEMCSDDLTAVCRRSHKAVQRSADVAALSGVLFRRVDLVPTA